jgi:hypothetical protein
MSDRGIEWDHGGGVVAGRVLVESLVRPVVGEMALVVVKDGPGVSLVVDQQPNESVPGQMAGPEQGV